MKFQIKLYILKDYLRRLSCSVQTISSRIEFTGILITVNDNSITFEGRNDYMDTKIEETSMTTVKIIETGKVLIKAATLNEIIQKMEGEFVTFTRVDSNLLTIDSKDSNYKINLLSDEKYEKAAMENSMENPIVISSSNFKESISKVIFAGDENNTKFIFQGVNISIDNGMMTTTVCDGIRIASHKSSQLSDIKINKIIPIRVVKELIKILPPTGEYKFSFKEDKGIVVAENMINQFSLIEGTFPVFDAHFELDKYNKTLIIDRSSLIKSIERATILNLNKADGSNRIELKITKDSVIIESKEQEVGSAKIELKEIEYEGEGINISMSPKIILDGIKSLETKKIKILFKEPEVPVLLKSEKDELNYLMSPMI